MEFTFGVTIEIHEPNEDPELPPKSKKFALTGRFPSPTYEDLESLVAAAVDFLNGHFGTKFVIKEREEEK